jgi:hypothetical protein
MALKSLIHPIILRLGMVTVWDGVGLGTLVGVIVLIWRVWVVEEAVHERIDGIDSSLGGVVGLMIEKIDTIGSRVPDINLINENPLAQLFDFLKGNAPQNRTFNPNVPPDLGQKGAEGVNSGNTPTKDSTGQFVEVVELDGTKKTEEN